MNQLETRFLNMREAGAYIGQSYRWMQRNYPNLLKNGVRAFRVPKNASKGHLVFEKASLDLYMESCKLTANF
jgi:hypothetical protein